MDSSRCRPCCSRRPVRALPPVRVLPIYYSWFPHFFLNVNLVKRRRAGDCLAWVSAGLRGLRYFEYYHLSRRLSREGTRVYRKRFIVGSFSLVGQNVGRQYLPNCE